MQDLRLLGVHEDGEHLLLADGDGARYQVAVDESLRAAVRREPPQLTRRQQDRDGGLRPRDVQALIRSGASAEEVAERAGWPVDKVRRYEGPILAEREYVAALARDARIRGRVGGAGAGTGPSGPGAPVLAARVGERLASRGVDVALVTWDSWRAEDGPWTVLVTFAAGGRQRQASWHFDAVDRVVVAVDDEARWLSEDQPRSDGAVLPPRGRPELSDQAGRATSVYDVEAEGGVQTGPPAAEPVDLMTAMRQRSGAGRRRSAVPGRIVRDTSTHPSDVLAGQQDEALPLEDLPVAPVAPVAAAAHADAPAEAKPADAGPVDTGPADTGPADEPAPAPSPEPETAGASPRRPPRRTSGRKGSRPSVPSWDDIMFGARQGSDSS